MHPETTLKKIVYLFGGIGENGNASIEAAKSLLPVFDAQAYKIKPVFLTPGNKWVAAEQYVSPAEAWSTAQDLLSQSGTIVEIALDSIQADEPYVVVLGLQGSQAEEGVIQALLTSRGLLFTGTDAEASAFASSRPKVLELLQNEEILTPEFLIIKPSTPLNEAKEFAEFYGWPVIMSKPQSTPDSEVVVADEEALAKVLSDRDDTSSLLLVTQPAGIAVVCCTLVSDKTTLIALSPLASEHTLDPTTKHDVQQMAIRVHKLIGADGYCQIDMVVQGSGDIVVLGVHTLPTLLPEGALVTSAAEYGISISQLLGLMIENVDRSDSDFSTFTLDIKNDEEGED